MGGFTRSLLWLDNIGHQQSNTMVHDLSQASIWLDWCCGKILNLLDVTSKMAVELYAIIAGGPADTTSEGLSIMGVEAIV